MDWGRTRGSALGNTDRSSPLEVSTVSRLPSQTVSLAIVGFFIGITSVLAVGVLLVTVKVVHFAAAPQTSKTPLSSTSIPAPTDTQLADSLAPQQADTPSPSPFPSVMGTAEAHLDAGEGVAAIELLVPLLD